MKTVVLEILATGLGVSFQDLGRCGWKRFGVPPGGALDEYAARSANTLVGNPQHLPVLEILLLGARFRALTRLEIALTGAAATALGNRWQTRSLAPDEVFEVPHASAGVWSYLACPGGFDAPCWFGSVSHFPRGGLGRILRPGEKLRTSAPLLPSLPSAIGARWLDPTETPDYRDPPPLRVWRGPQWAELGPKVAASFFDASWQISARSDRTGYRLSGPSLGVAATTILSEPVLPGSIQIPPDGQPIVTMRDGPTVGGYPKLGLVDPEDLSRFAQCRPGQSVRFIPAEP